VRKLGNVGTHAFGETITSNDVRRSLSELEPIPSLNSYLRKFRSIWSKWLVKQFRLVSANPWLHIPEVEEGDRVTDFPLQSRSSWTSTGARTSRSTGRPLPCACPT
jgi:hypothetical protein